MQFRPAAEIAEEAKNVLGMTASADIAAYVREQQALDREQRQADRDRADREAEQAEAVRKHELEMKKLQLQEMDKTQAFELEKAKLEARSSENSGDQANINSVVTAPSSAVLDKFKEREELEPFLARFQDVASRLKWSDDAKAIQFMNLFTGRPLDILIGIEAEDRSYERMREALKQAYGISSEKARNQFF